MFRDMGRKGFTLIEILTTVVIIGILFSLAVPIGQLILLREQERSLKETLYETRKAIDKFYKYYGHYPVFWAELRGEAPPAYSITCLADAPPMNPFTGDPMDWMVETSGITEYNGVGLYRTRAVDLKAHNLKVADNAETTGVESCGEPGCVGYWGIWNIRYPREDRIAINDTFYSDW
jgi:prepilin-type N-terminal cleavage/methylation domain-containing protein